MSNKIKTRIKLNCVFDDTIFVKSDSTYYTRSIDEYMTDDINDENLYYKTNDRVIISCIGNKEMLDIYNTYFSEEKLPMSSELEYDDDFYDLYITVNGVKGPMDPNLLFKKLCQNEEFLKKHKGFEIIEKDAILRHYDWEEDDLLQVETISEYSLLKNIARISGANLTIDEKKSEAVFELEIDEKEMLTPFDDYRDEDVEEDKIGGKILKLLDYFNFNDKFITIKFIH